MRTEHVTGGLCERLFGIKLRRGSMIVLIMHRSRARHRIRLSGLLLSPTEEEVSDPLPNGQCTEANTYSYTYSDFDRLLGIICRRSVRSRRRSQ